MSSTGRAPRGGDGVDNFPTPSWCVDALLDALPLPRGGTWLEPAVGAGAIVRAVEAHQPGERTWLACDVRDLVTPPYVDGQRLIRGDFTTAQLPEEWARPTVTLTNPPFSAALPFVRRALEVTEAGGVVAMLLRLAFLASQERADFMREHVPDIYTLAKRPSFTANGRTDSADYAWFVWRVGERRRYGELHPSIGGTP